VLGSDARDSLETKPASKEEKNSKKL
jgi:hypothetical protein